MKTIDNEAGVKYARKGYYKGTEVTVTHRYGSQVWLEDYPIRHKNGPTEWGCWVEGESVTYKDSIDDAANNVTEGVLDVDSSTADKKLKSSQKKKNNPAPKPTNRNNKYSGKANSLPKGNNGGAARNRRGSTRNS